MLYKRILKKILISTGALFTLLLIYLLPSSNKDDVDKVNIDLSYQESEVYLLNDKNMLSKTSVIINNTDTVSKASELLDVLIISGKGESSIKSGFKSYIPSETRINAVLYENNILYVDFSPQIFDIEKDLEVSMIEGIVYTLTSIDDVDGVILSVDGAAIEKLPNSNIVIPKLLTRKFGINKRYDLTSIDDIDTITEYYVSEHNGNNYYVPVTKVTNDSREKIKVIIEDLTSSDISETDLMSFINGNTKLLKTNIDNDIMYLTFNSYILNDFDSKSILEEVINTISLSVKDNYDVSEVVFYVDDVEICKSVLKTLE